MTSFYCYLSSDSSEAYYPANTKANFKVLLMDPIELDTAFSWEVGLTEVIFPNLANDESKIDLSNAKAGPIFIYVDALSRTRVSHESSKLLRIVSSTSAHQIFTAPYYVPLEYFYITDLTVLLAQRSGEKYPFNSGKIPVILVLHFRRRAI